MEMEYTVEEQLIILQQFHDSKLGYKETFNWKGIKNNIKEYIKKLYIMSKG